MGLIDDSPFHLKGTRTDRDANGTCMPAIIEVVLILHYYQLVKKDNDDALDHLICRFRFRI